MPLRHHRQKRRAQSDLIALGTPTEQLMPRGYPSGLQGLKSIPSQAMVSRGVVSIACSCMGDSPHFIIKPFGLRRAARSRATVGRVVEDPRHGVRGDPKRGFQGCGKRITKPREFTSRFEQKQIYGKNRPESKNGNGRF